MFGPPIMLPLTPTPPPPSPTYNFIHAWNLSCQYVYNSFCHNHWFNSLMSLDHENQYWNKDIHLILCQCQVLPGLRLTVKVYFKKKSLLWQKLARRGNKILNSKDHKISKTLIASSLVGFVWYLMTIPLGMIHHIIMLFHSWFVYCALQNTIFIDFVLNDRR